MMKKEDLLSEQSFSIVGKSGTGTTTFLFKDGSSLIIDLRKTPVHNRPVGRSESQAVEFSQEISELVFDTSSVELSFSFKDGSSFSMSLKGIVKLS